MKKNSKKKKYYLTICKNKNSYFNYFIKEKYECGLSLKGWEIKSIRSRRTNIHNSYIFIREGNAYIVGVSIRPLYNTSLSSESYKDKRNIQLLLHKKEINYLLGKISREGYSLIALSLILKKSWCKIIIGLAKGKKNIDKRICEKNKEWRITKNRIFKNSFKN
ncbi:SsrA-binding protein SmpB [Buchnera aphidicola (Kurisakia onigurumii)]|uniref:SsrA-binding protein SmpB n=1 Tax=Buchnera aphidicola TaxID=9 RepID=UPI0031B6A2B6